MHIDTRSGSTGVSVRSKVAWLLALLQLLLYTPRVIASYTVYFRFVPEMKLLTDVKEIH